MVRRNICLMLDLGFDNGSQIEDADNPGGCSNLFIK
jgi:hypothetical protein